MKIIAATEAKNRLGGALKFGNDESLLIQKHGKEAYLAFTAETGKRLVLANYSTGLLGRTDAMGLLGIDWYGDLLDALRDANLPPPSLDPAIREEMIERAVEILKKSTEA